MRAFSDARCPGASGTRRGWPSRAHGKQEMALPPSAFRDRCSFRGIASRSGETMFGSRLRAARSVVARRTGSSGSRKSHRPQDRRILHENDPEAKSRLLSETEYSTDENPRELVAGGA